jgi:hypothetical protein
MSNRAAKTATSAIAAAPTAVNLSSSSPPLVLVEARELDILCGKDKNLHNHLGNRLFRERIEAMKTVYQNAKNKPQRIKITKDIIKYFQTKLGSRFLKKATYPKDHHHQYNNSSNAASTSTAATTTVNSSRIKTTPGGGGGGGGEYCCWVEIGFIAARDKVSHALRFANRHHYHHRDRDLSTASRGSHTPPPTGTIGAAGVAISSPSSGSSGSGNSNVSNSGNRTSDNNNHQLLRLQSTERSFHPGSGISKITSLESSYGISGVSLRLGDTSSSLMAPYHSSHAGISNYDFSPSNLSWTCSANNNYKNISDNKPLHSTIDDMPSYSVNEPGDDTKRLADDLFQRQQHILQRDLALKNKEDDDKRGGGNSKAAALPCRFHHDDDHDDSSSMRLLPLPLTMLDAAAANDSSSSTTTITTTRQARSKKSLLHAIEYLTTMEPHTDFMEEGKHPNNDDHGKSMSSRPP